MSTQCTIEYLIGTSCEVAIDPRNDSSSLMTMRLRGAARITLNRFIYNEPNTMMLVFLYTIVAKLDKSKFPTIEN